jgi:hypothetical protein
LYDWAEAGEARPSTAIAAATMNLDLVDIAIFVTLDIAYLLRLFAAMRYGGTPDKIDKRSRYSWRGESWCVNFQITFSSPVGNKFIVIWILFNFIGPNAFARGLVRFSRNPVPNPA